MFCTTRSELLTPKSEGQTTDFRNLGFDFRNSMKYILFSLLFSLTAPLYAQTQESVTKFQNDLNKEFKNKDTSPLSETERKKFKNHSFYPVEPSFAVTARLERTDTARFIEMSTTTTRKDLSRIYGFVSFELQGKNYRLPVYQSKSLMATPDYADYLFFPFTDPTNGQSTYHGGRYIDLRIPKNSLEIGIDFNKAYNPSCAYNPKYSCPLVPKANHIDIPVTAGLKFEGHSDE
jgi:uncharacterized protein